MIAMLSASLALVKPAGMTPKEAKDWILVAYDSLRHLPYPIFEAAVRAARLECDHPAKIVPTVIKQSRDALLWRRVNGPVLRLVQTETPRLTGPLPDPHEMMPDLRRIGLLNGWLVEGDNGRIEWSKDTAA
ncbi:hypothetical protein [uncultured Novosphingobium sp.]|uniref:hypothetical protein n=1 Tax=uncultured Novosphingobium sp. TaxID=292277 RepID=UPI002595FFFF|nr:hypothetical protein [uncultured Novosphingobium sp.]